MSMTLGGVRRWIAGVRDRTKEKEKERKYKKR